jgi:hypothetical protein
MVQEEEKLHRATQAQPRIRTTHSSKLQKNSSETSEADFLSSIMVSVSSSLQSMVVVLSHPESRLF